MHTLLFVTPGLLREAVTFLPRGAQVGSTASHGPEVCAEAGSDEFYLPQAEPGKGLWKVLPSGSAQGDSSVSQNSVLVAAVRRDAGSCWKELGLRAG